MPAIKIDYAVRETVTNMKRNVFMLVQAVIVVAITLFLVGGVLIFSGSVNRAADLQTRKVEVGVFLATDVTPEQRDRIKNDLLAMPEVGNVIYESKHEAFERFKVLFKDSPDIVQNVTEDKLPESYRVKLKNPKDFGVVRDRLTGVPGIDTIRDEHRFVARLLRFVAAIRVFGLGLVGVFALAAGVLIYSTIRLAIYARRKEIAIMKLVGATNWFIRVPFMMEGIIQGLLGAVIAVLALVAFRPLFGRLLSVLKFLGASVSVGDVLIQTFWLVLVGVVIGAAGSLLGVRRFLEV